MADNFTDENGLPTFFKNRQVKRFKIEKLEPESSNKPTKKELIAEADADAKLYTEHRREMFAAESELINSVGRKTWDSTKTKFRKGDSYSMTFLNDEEETEVRKNRFSGSINLNSAFNQVKQNMINQEEMKQKINRDLNKLESDHMEWCAGVYDRSNRQVIKDIRSNIYTDRNLDKETGNTSKITKSQSKYKNDAILSELRKDPHSGGRLRMNTTIGRDADGDQFEKDSILSEKNIKFADLNVKDEAAYHEEKLRNVSTPFNFTT